MRYAAIIALVFLVSACGSKTAQDETDVITRVGVIKSKQEVDMHQVEKNTRGTTSVHASVSGGSGGSGVSIGIGFLVGVFGSGDSEPEPLRYEVELDDGGQITVFHESDDFEVDDCVRISVYPDEEEHPPTMSRFKDGCE